MTRALAIIVVALALVGAGCKEYGPPLPPKGKSVSKAATDAGGPVVGQPRVVEGADKLRGRVRFGGRQWPVALLVGHDAKADLFTHCRKLVDSAKEAAAGQGGANVVKVPPLCYAAEPRQTVATIRVEFDAKGTGGRAIGMLRDNDEGAHFYIEPTGSVFQVLNLAYAPRREGQYRAGEVRVLSANAEVHKQLVSSLTALLGPVPVTEVPVSFAARRKAPPKPGSPHSPPSPGDKTQ